MEPDPWDELFDVVTRDGEPTGHAKPRAAVHRDGDWHRSFHCWVGWHGDDGEPLVLFQRRSMQKDTEPDKLDVAVGGHYRAGETLNDVVREIDEEIGIAVRLDDVIPVGRRWAENIRGGWVDREIQDVFIYRLDAGLAALRAAPDEISALYVVATALLPDLFSGAASAIPVLRADVRPDGRLAPPRPAEVIADDFIAVTDDYWIRGAQVTERVLAGERPAGW